MSQGRMGSRSLDSAARDVEMVARHGPATRPPDEMTRFDSPGVSLQDVVTARWRANGQWRPG